MTATADLRHEYALASRGFARIAGLDEAGRGAWAGPVVAGAVILPLDRFDLAHALRGVNDSKQLTPAEREALLPAILETAVAVGVGHAAQGEIDALGIVPATRRAMQRALDVLPVAPDALLVDGRALLAFALPCLALVRGDQQSLSIAAASIVAKVTRDRFMDSLDDLFPQYGFREHKGYGTPQHQGALRHFGPCAAHRLTFAPLRALLPDAEEQLAP